MAFSIIYKRLFEIRGLLGFGLDAADGTAFHDRPADEQETAQDRFDIRNWISIIPTEETARLMAGLKIKTHQNADSFFAGISVLEEDNGGNQEFRPQIAPVDGTRFRFLLKAKSPFLYNITNLPWNPPFDAKLWFSNTLTTNYPSLSNPVNAYAAGADYPMGSLVEQGGSIFEAIVNLENAATTPGTDPAIWIAVNDHDYVHPGDLRLINTRFTYRLPSAANEQNVDWEIVTPGPVVIASGNRTETNPFASIGIDLGETEPGSYTLNLTGTNGFSASHEVILEPELARMDILGVVEIIHDAGLGDSRLLENTGVLRTEANVTTTPAFEIRLRRRSAYFRYHFMPELNPVPALGDLELDSGNIYRTINPIPLLKERVSVSYSGGTLLPNASFEQLKNDADRVFSEIYIYL
ncbi:MAG: hypothetical protein AB8F95_19430 [Bacteroidia bacterium]